jgi:hypothetical protein
VFTDRNYLVYRWKPSVTLSVHTAAHSGISQGNKMITAHLTKVKNGWQLTLVNGVQPLLENIITKVEFKEKREAKKFALSQNAKPWNYV